MTYAVGGLLVWDDTGGWYMPRMSGELPTGCVVMRVVRMVRLSNCWGLDRLRGEHPGGQAPTLTRPGLLEEYESLIERGL
jgi:hypothetical protein